jgi:tetratricopeptide (TPR) repeat protein
MTDPSKVRRQKLEEFLAQNPNDAFARYGIALDCFRQGELDAADAHFKAILANNPDYVPAYQMYAQMLAQNDRLDEAKSVLNLGIQAAIRVGNQHAGSEMESHLADLG